MLSVISLGTITPSVVQASEVISHQELHSSVAQDFNQEDIIQNILIDINASLPSGAELDSGLGSSLGLSTPIYETMGVGGLWATLIAKYGKIYVMKTLPRIIYKHLAGLIGKKISEATFVHVFGNIINWASSYAVEQALAGALINLGIAPNIANTVSTVVVTVAWWFVL